MGALVMCGVIFFALLAATALGAAAFGRSLEDVSRWIESL